MDNLKQECKLCDNIISDKNLKVAKYVAKEILDILLPKLTHIDTQNVMCTMCSSKLIAALNFKSKCLQTEKTIISFVDLKNPKPIDLKQIYAKEKEKKQGGKSLDDRDVCRLCLQPMLGDHKSIQEVPVSSIEIYIPEINLEATTNPVICTKCHDALHVHSTFIKNCLGVDKNRNGDSMNGQDIFLNDQSLKTEEIEVKSEETEGEITLETHCDITKEEHGEGNTSLQYRTDLKHTEESTTRAQSTFANNQSEECSFKSTSESPSADHKRRHKRGSQAQANKSSCRVCDLKKLDFSNLSLEEKVDLKNNGRPTPVLSLVQVQKECKSRPAFTRKFDKNIYDKTLWLCGCDEQNSLFCFVCLLFGGEDNWTKAGVSDLKHLPDKIKKHENSPRHKSNLVSFLLLGRVNIASCLSSAEQINNHNEIVKKNRVILSKIIDILKLCVTCNLPLHGHNETSDSVNKGVFLELVDYTRKIDPVLDKHLSDAHVFKGTSKTVQNELLQCMFEVCREHISQEIADSSFLAVMSDDTTDIATHTQSVLVFRYELNGRLFERFWGFSNPEGRDADRLSECILRQLEPLIKNCPNKLVAQTYDGAVVMRGHLRGVTVKIKEIYKNAHFVYCYAHQLNKLLEQAVSSIPSVRIFFLNLTGIASFFLNSPDRAAALKDVCDKRIRRSSQICWNTHSETVQTIFTYKEDILTCFTNIQIGQPKKYNSETTLQAAGFAKWLEDDSFLFWLNFFAQVMPHVDILYNQLQKIEKDPAKAIECFEKAIENILNSLPPVEDTTPDETSSNITRKRRRLDDENFNLSAREVCDIITVQIKERFTFKYHLSGEKLFLKDKYAEYQKALPLNDIEQFCTAFPMVDKEVLKTELNIFYSRSELIDDPNTSGCLTTLNLIIALGLDGVFKEITQALRILVSIPMTTAEPERCFSKLKLIKTFLRNTMCEDRLNALGMLSIESCMVQNIPDFSEKVVQKFVADESRRMDFNFKK